MSFQVSFPTTLLGHGSMQRPPPAPHGDGVRAGRVFSLQPPANQGEGDKPNPAFMMGAEATSAARMELLLDGALVAVPLSGSIGAAPWPLGTIPMFSVPPLAIQHPLKTDVPQAHRTRKAP